MTDMSIKVATFFCISIFALTAKAKADEDCLGVISFSKIKTSKVQNKSEVESHASNFCSEYQKHSASRNSKSFGASYKFLSASMSNANSSEEDVAQKYCSASNASSAKNDAFSEYVESIAPGAFDSYRACLDYKSQGITYNIDQAKVLEKELSVRVINKMLAKGNVDMQVASSANVKCSWRKSKTENSSIANSSSDLLTCVRTDSSQKESVTIYPDNALPELSFIWPAYQKGTPIDYLEDIKNKYEAGLAAIDDLRNSGIPLGTIVSSTLDWGQFQLNVGGAKRWVPADGRDIPADSKYAVLFPGQKAPDLRGIFLRGLNTFESGKDRKDGKQDPDGANRVSGDYQSDTLKRHTHKAQGKFTGVPGGGGEAVGNPTLWEINVKENEDGGMETRPRNIAVYYYLRIN